MGDDNQLGLQIKVTGADAAAGEVSKLTKAEQELLKSINETTAATVQAAKVSQAQLEVIKANRAAREAELTAKSTEFAKKWEAIQVSKAAQQATEAESGALKNLGQSAGGAAPAVQGVTGSLLGMVAGTTALTTALQPLWLGLGNVTGEFLKQVVTATGLDRTYHNVVVAMGFAKSEQQLMREEMDKASKASEQETARFNAQINAVDRLAQETANYRRELEQLTQAEEKRKSELARDQSGQAARVSANDQAKAAEIDVRVARGEITKAEGERQKAQLGRDQRAAAAAAAVKNAQDETGYDIEGFGHVTGTIEKSINETKAARDKKQAQRDDIGVEERQSALDRERQALEETRRKLRGLKEPSMNDLLNDPANAGVPFSELQKRNDEAERKYRDDKASLKYQEQRQTENILGGKDTNGNPIKGLEDQVKDKIAERAQLDTEIKEFNKRLEALNNEMANAQQKLANAKSAQEGVSAQNRGEQAREAIAGGEQLKKSATGIEEGVVGAANAVNRAARPVLRRGVAEEAKDARDQARQDAKDDKEENKRVDKQYQDAQRDRFDSRGRRRIRTGGVSTGNDEGSELDRFNAQPHMRSTGSGKVTGGDAGGSAAAAAVQQLAAAQGAAFQQILAAAQKAITDANNATNKAKQMQASAGGGGTSSSS